MIEVTRRIDREAGSTYRVNGKEVRARDVQLLFADASTGARSPALVRQGQIGEIISAKPQARRLILEEAAGVSGLHSRRHEAELRLKGAEENLLRVEDVIKQLDGQVESLKKQARQSNRYRALAADIRRHAALAHLIAWREHEAHFAEARRKLEADILDVAERTRAQGEAARLQAIAAADLPALRDEEARRGAALHRITLARDTLAAEEKRAVDRKAELERRLAQFARDLEREQALIADAAGVGERLAAEDFDLAAAGEGEGDAGAQAARARGGSRDPARRDRGRASGRAGRLLRPQRPPSCARRGGDRGRPPSRPARSGPRRGRARVRIPARGGRRGFRARRASGDRGRSAIRARRGRAADGRGRARASRGPRRRGPLAPAARRGRKGRATARNRGPHARQAARLQRRPALSRRWSTC